MARSDSGVVPAVRTLGRYELFAKLGSGGMAEVHLARQRGLRRFRKLVVVKTVHPQLARDERFVDLLLDEARISALLKHPRVVDIYDVDEDDGVVFIAMEYLPGQSMTDVIKAGRKGKKLDVLSSARIIADAAEGLDAAHNLRTHSGQELQLVHRDVSPGNIVVLYRGEVKIVDFGVAKARDHLTSSAIGKFAGKLGYAAPEQLESENADRRSDVFSLGVVFWELLCLRRLFPAKSREQALALVSSGKAPKPSTVRPEVMPEFDEICLRALSPKPADRFQTAKEMFRELDSVLAKHGYRRESDLIAQYMDEVFGDERSETEALVRRVSESTNQISIAEIAREDAATMIDEALPDKIAAAQLANLAAAPVGHAIGTEPGAQKRNSKLRELVRPGSPWRRPALYGVLAVLGILLGFVVLEVATSGTSQTAATPAVVGGATSAAASDEPDASSGEVLDAQAAIATDAPVPAPPETPTLDEQPLPTDRPVSDDKPPPETAANDDVAPPDRDEIKPKPPTIEKRKPQPDPKEDELVAPPEEVDKEAQRAAAAARYREGAKAFRSGNISLAAKRMSQAIEADQTFAKAHRGLGLVHEKRGNKKAAARSFRRYLALRPGAGDKARIEKIIAELEK